MEQDEYLRTRLYAEIDWYEMKSARNKKLYLSLNSIQLFCAAVLALLAFFTDERLGVMQALFVILPVVIMLCFGLAAIHKYHEHWIKYRTSAESLKHIRYLFESGSAPFDGEDAYNALVVRVEALISPDHTDRTERTKNN